MKSANWEPCSAVSINSELHNLREVRTNLIECLDSMPKDNRRTKLTVALSFVQMAIDALTTFPAERATSA
jgi:hypothetical protein